MPPRTRSKSSKLKESDSTSPDPVSAKIHDHADGETQHSLTKGAPEVLDDEYGPLTSDKYRYVSKMTPEQKLQSEVIPEPPYMTFITVFLSYLVLIIFGHIEDFFEKQFRREKFKECVIVNGFAPWFSDFESFYFRRMKRRLDDCFQRPTTGVPGRFVRVLDRTPLDFYSKYEYTGTSTKCMNLSSYNYLGFAQSAGSCTDHAEDVLHKYGTTSGGPRNKSGTTDLHLETEQVIADFIGKEAALVFSMGYGTNANLFSSLVDSKCLVISDELNHGSIRVGVRLAGAVIKVYKHNDMEDLEKVLREQISQGQSKTHRPWKKIWILCEGLFSMEGTTVKLEKVIALKKKYKCYLFVDEAHSVGAMGPNGKGICEYYGVDPADVDILMGTLTKSFGATGGYVAADKYIIDRLRVDISTNGYAESMSPPVLAQIITSLKIISGEKNPGEGKERLERLAFNSRYLRLGLKRLGFLVYGNDDSPVIPLLLYNPSKMAAFSRRMLAKKIAVVVVGYPATPLTSNRVRLCMSSALTKEDLDEFLRVCSAIGDELLLKYNTDAGYYNDKRIWDVEEVIAKGVEDVKRPVLY